MEQNQKTRGCVLQLPSLKLSLQLRLFRIALGTGPTTSRWNWLPSNPRPPFMVMEANKTRMKAECCSLLPLAVCQFLKGEPNPGKEFTCVNKNKTGS